MDRGTKRKAAPSSAQNGDGRNPKRQRTPTDPHYVPEMGETAESATEMGWKFIKQLKSARDKMGRLISTDFLSLPDKAEFPQYYEQIQMPIAVETLETKLDSKQYPHLASLESDVKRMVSNAKAFNETSSEIYQDAERIRKMTSNFMVKHNPAYRDKDYVAFPTPIPDHLITEPSSHQQNGVSAPPAASKPAVLKLSVPAAPAKAEEESEPDESADESFKGKTFQQAQDQIITQLMNYNEPDGELEIFTPFVNLPPRSLTDYYNFIKQPLSLKGLLKRVHGVHGRHETTGITDFKTWDAFEAEFGRIWQNAREYNEDGSDIFELSIQLEEVFKAKLAQAKEEVDEPSQPTLKLNLGAKPVPIKLRLGSAKASPGPQRQDSITPSAGSGTPGISVDRGALQRQKEVVQAGVNGIKLSKDTQTRTPSIPQLPVSVPALPSVPQTGSVASKSPPKNGDIKSETTSTPAVGPTATPGPTGMLTTAPSLSGSSMPPPSTGIGLPNGVTYPSMPTPTPYHFPATGLDSKWRPDGKDASSALLTNLSIATHPDLRVSKPLRVNIPPHAALSQQSVTLTLPPAHTTLRFQPILHPSLVAYSAYANPALAVANSTAPLRPYKLFVTANGQRVQSTSSALSPPPSTATAAAALSAATSLQQGTPPRSASNAAPVYDVKLVPGVNRIEVEVVSAIPVPVTKQQAAPAQNTRNASAQAGGLELERVSVFVHLTRWPPL